MTETTEEKAQQMAERYHSTDFKDLKIKSLEAQVTSLTEEIDTLKDLTQFRGKIAKDTVKENISLRSQLSNRDKEIKELEAKLSEHDKGLPIEKADKKKKYHWHNGREWVVLFWNQGWKFKAVKVLPIAMNVIDDDLDRLYPLPSETKEGS